MNCKNCGEKVSFISNYCENCGAEVESAWIIAKSKTLKFLAFLKKRKLAVCIIVVCLAAIIIFSSVWDVTHRIDLTDYITVNISGFDGKGEIEPTIDYSALCEKLLGEEPDTSTKKGYEKIKEYNKKRELIAESLKISADRTEELSNGDIFIVQITVINESVFKDLGYNLTEEEYLKAIQIGVDCDSFNDPAVIEPLQFTNVFFSGANGQGEYEIHCSSEPIEVRHPTAGKVDLKLEYYESYYQSAICMTVNETETIYIDLIIEYPLSLSNGDKFKIYIDEDSIAELQELGFIITNTGKTVIVSGLE